MIELTYMSLEEDENSGIMTTTFSFTLLVENMKGSLKYIETVTQKRKHNAPLRFPRAYNLRECSVMNLEAISPLNPVK